MSDQPPENDNKRDHHYDKTDLDLISLVQRARMKIDDEMLPSNIAAVYWLEAKCQVEHCAEPTPHSGQWSLDTTLGEVDALWLKIKQATKDGLLGYKSKVSTSPRSGQGSDSRTICVRTYDSTDEADVNRIRKALRTLGIEGDWYYETDKDE